MRVAAVLCMLAAGCNQVFGLDRTDPLPDIDASTLPHVRLTWQIANKLPSGPDPMIEYAPIEPAPAVRIGRVDGPLLDAAYLPDGSIEIPEDFPGTIWRLEYTIDSVAHEVHWSPARNEGHVVVPLAGRLRRDPVPSGGGYRIMATGGPASHPNARVYTTGVWTDGAVSSGVATVDYPFNLARSLGGPLGAPDQSKGDDGVLVDLVTAAGPTGNCVVASGSASFKTPVMTGALSPVAASYFGSGQGATVSYKTLSLLARLGGALGNRKGPMPSEGRTLLGYVPSTALPGFVQPVLGLLPTAGPALPGPALLPLADCPGQSDLLPASLPASARPSQLTGFPLVAHAEFWDQRRTSPTSPFLISGIAASMTSTVDKYDLDMEVPFATRPKLGTIDLGELVSDPVPVTAGRLELTYDLDQSVFAHYYELVLYEVVEGTSPQLVRDRVYTTTTPKVFSFDTSVLTAGKVYVFSIHVYRGRPLASTGDYTRVEYPQSATTIFTRTFVAQ